MQKPNSRYNLGELILNQDNCINETPPSFERTYVKGIHFDDMIQTSIKVDTGEYEGIYFETVDGYDCIKISGIFNEVGNHPIKG